MYFIRKVCTTETKLKTVSVFGVVCTPSVLETGFVLVVQDIPKNELEASSPLWKCPGGVMVFSGDCSEIPRSAASFIVTKVYKETGVRARPVRDLAGNPQFVDCRRFANGINDHTVIFLLLESSGKNFSTKAGNGVKKACFKSVDEISRLLAQRKFLPKHAKALGDYLLL